MSELSGLLSWCVLGGEADLHAPRVRAHSLFAQAARALAANTLAAGENDKTLADIAKDAGRYVVAMWSMYLHVTGGLTLPRLKEICASSGFLSPGRARTMLLFMRYLGYVAPDGAREKGKPQRYVPTPGFRESWRDHLRAALMAAEIIEPGVSEVHERLDEDSILDAVSRLQGDGLLALAKTRNHETSYMRVFMHRHAGNQILFTLIGEGAGSDFPPRGPMPLPVAALAKRFGVSRIHIRRIQRDAVQEGFFTCPDDNTVLLTDKACEELCESYAAQIAQLLSSAAGALADDATPKHARSNSTPLNAAL